MDFSLKFPQRTTKRSWRGWGWAREASDTLTGICGGYIFLARDFTTTRSKGEIDLVRFDGKTLAFVEVRTRTAIKGKPGLPELSFTREKHEVFVRTAKMFLREWHLPECPVRFDVVAIDNSPGKPPLVRLHKDALSPDIRRNSASRI